MRSAKILLVLLFSIGLLVPSLPARANTALSAATPLFTLTPSITLTATKTPVPNARPTYTEARTGLDPELKPTLTSRPTVTRTAITPTTTVEPAPAASEEKETGNQSPLSIAIIGMVATFIAGFVMGTLWSSLRKR